MPIINVDQSALPLLKAMASEKDWVISHIGKQMPDGTIDVVISLPTFYHIVRNRSIGESYTTVILRIGAK